MAELCASITGTFLLLAMAAHTCSGVLPENRYTLKYLTFFVRDVNLESFVVGPAETNVPISLCILDKKIGSISNTIAKLSACMEEDKKLARTVAKIKSGYDT